MAKWCLYCRLQFLESARFCSECGRLLESGFRIHPVQDSSMHSSEAPARLHQATPPGKDPERIREKL